ncbi:hypothetical protein KBB96_03540 [Luteolibacter ambystomatis]|uniref:RRM domain-containing protein n=2 Tax=Luteolibacter ambystomatis TaxID=2824561 RepID=A0A975J3I1_9BACT|nr:hypothetical protein KBB96_03540 [Luteolibacter ambystomatis]
MPQPAKLTWWQKFLKIFGLYKEPVRPTRQDRIQEREKDAPAKSDRPAQPVKSNIRIARPQERKEQGPVESPRLYLGNLSYEVTESDLTDLFKGIGGVRNVEVVYNRNTHRSKGYGFVEMLHVDDAKRAIEVLNDQFFMGRKLSVSSAKSKGQDEREDKEEREERQERRPRNNPAPAQSAAAVAVPVAAAAVAAVAVEAAAEAPAPVAAVEEAAAPVVAEAASAPVVEEAAPVIAAVVEEAPAAVEVAEAAPVEAAAEGEQKSEQA